MSSSSSISTNGSGGGVNNFKISRLNDALQAINPRYQPIGFSITSVESCSPSVLQDAISAAETGVYTLLSVIGKNCKIVQPRNSDYKMVILNGVNSRDQNLSLKF